MKTGDDLPLDAIQYLFNRITLERPLVILDVETTGLNPDTDRIVELGAVKLKTDRTVTAYNARFNPGIPINPDATAVHGITDADVATERPFSEAARMLHASLSDVDLAGYNIRRFDTRILQAEFSRAGLTWVPGLVVDLYAIWCQRERRDLAGAIKRFAPAFVGAAGGHSAVGDVLGVAAALEGALGEFWPDSGRVDGFGRPTVKELGEAGRDPDWLDADGKVIQRNGVPTMNIGKHVGVAVADLPWNYVDWLIRSDFPQDVKDLILSIRKKKGRRG